MNEKLQNFIIKNLTMMPGITGIANADFTKSNSKLKEANFDKGIIIEKTSKGLFISVAIIIDTDANVQVISQELSQAIRNKAKAEKIKIGKIRIYVRGVK